MELTTSPDTLAYYESALATTADSRAPDAKLYSGASGSLAMPWDSTASINAVALLPGQSSAGRGGPRAVAATDSGLGLSDPWVGDYTAGMSQQIRQSYVGPMALSDPVVVFSSLNTANVYGRAYTDASASVVPATAITTDGPLSHSWDFAGSDSLTISDMSSLSIGGNGLSIVFWIRPDTSAGWQEVVRKAGEYAIYIRTGTRRIEARIGNPLASA